jgi:hypothetical protein
MELVFPKKYILPDNKVLFYNIINRNNNLILICPPDIDDKKILIKYKNNSLRLSNVFSKNNIKVITYVLISNDEYNDIEIHYAHSYKRFNILNIKKIQNTDSLSIATLFNSLEHFTEFYNYYTNQGVKHFYCYSNFKIDDAIQDALDKENVTLIEWDYKTAQSNVAYMQDALYNYGLSNMYIGFCDINNFLNCDNKILKTLITSDKDAYIFHNKWTESVANETEVKVDNINFEKNSNFRIKQLIKTSSVSLVSSDENIYLKKNPSIEKGHINYNFYKWTSNECNANPNILWNINMVDKEIINKEANKTEANKTEANKTEANKEKTTSQSVKKPSILQNINGKSVLGNNMLINKTIGNNKFSVSRI